MNVIKEKSFEFALNIVQLNQFLISEKREYVLSKQVLRSGKSISALLIRGMKAESLMEYTLLK